MEDPMSDQGAQETGTVDVVYNLVSILYHALEGAEVYSMYVEDAEQSGDTELAQFFQDVQREEKQRADRAKKLLGQRLNQGGGR
jgi:rubrerythrin